MPVPFLTSQRAIGSGDPFNLPPEKQELPPILGSSALMIHWNPRHLLYSVHDTFSFLLDILPILGWEAFSHDNLL